MKLTTVMTLLILQKSRQRSNPIKDWDLSDCISSRKETVSVGKV